MRTTLIISGVLSSDKSSVVKILEQSEKNKKYFKKKEWICITAEI